MARPSYNPVSSLASLFLDFLLGDTLYPPPLAKVLFLISFAVFLMSLGSPYLPVSLYPCGVVIYW
jgi:hypothetical protein